MIRQPRQPENTDVDGPRAASRRAFLRGVGGAMAVGVVGGSNRHAFAASRDTQNLFFSSRFPIALNDRSLGMRQTLGSFDFARSAGAAGVEVDFGRLGSRPAMNTRLNDAAGRQVFLDAAARADVRISSLALTAFANQPFADHPQALSYTDDFIYALRQMDVRVGVLPIGGCCDLTNASTVARCVERLKAIAPLAERAGVALAIDAPLSAVAMRDLLDGVASPAVQVCVAIDVTDLADAVRTVGLHRIAQLRFQFDDQTGQSAKLRAVHDVLGPTDWRGWIVIDRPAACAGDILGDASLAVRRLASALSPALV